MILIDAHEDLAWNMLTFKRDYTRSAAESRQLELGTPVPEYNGDTLLGWEDYQQGEVAVVFGTLFAAPERRRLGEWDTQSYRSTEEAHRRYSAQLDAYHRLTDENPDKFRLIHTQADLFDVLDHWETKEKDHPVGIVVLMENAEGVRSMIELDDWYQRGVRIIGPAWAGTRFCGGTREPGPLTKHGFALLEAMASYKFILDLSHMDEQAVWQSLETYSGTVIASHSNALSLLKGMDSNRFLTDPVIEGIVERDGVIGIVPFNKFLRTGWQVSDRRESVTLHDVAAHIDHVCQIAGDARHVGIGTDFDGGFGMQSAPKEINTIADLQRVAPILSDMGYSDEHIARIFHGNWMDCLVRALPD
jgi:membrane dipeptidase